MLDARDLRAGFGEKAPASRPRQHAREIDDAQILHRRQRLRRRLADARDFNQRHARNGLRLRGRVPFRKRQGRGGDGAGLRERSVEFGAVAQPDARRNVIAIRLSPQHAKRAGAVVREVHMQEDRAPVARLVETRQRIARRRDRGAIEPHMAVAFAHQRGLIEVDAHAARLAGQGKSSSRQRDAGRSPRLKAAWVKRVLARERDARGVVRGPSGLLQQRAQGCFSECHELRIAMTTSASQ